MRKFGVEKTDRNPNRSRRSVMPKAALAIGSLSIVAIGAFATVQSASAETTADSATSAHSANSSTATNGEKPVVTNDSSSPSFAPVEFRDQIVGTASDTLPVGYVARLSCTPELPGGVLRVPVVPGGSGATRVPTGSTCRVSEGTDSGSQVTYTPNQFTAGNSPVLIESTHTYGSPLSGAGLTPIRPAFPCPKPAPAPVAKPCPEPAPVPVAKPCPEPAPVPVVTEPRPEPAPVPVAKPCPEPVPVPVAKPCPEPTPVPVPPSESTPTPVAPPTPEAPRVPTTVATAPPAAPEQPATTTPETTTPASSDTPSVVPADVPADVPAGVPSAEPPTPALAPTGAEVIGIIGLAALVAAAGLILVVMARRRRV